MFPHLVIPALRNMTANRQKPMKRLHLHQLVLAVAVFASFPLFVVQTQARGDAKSMVGIWKLSLPVDSRSSFFGKTTWSPNVETFCRIEDSHTSYSVHCLGLHFNDGLISKGMVNIDGNRVRLLWGSPFNGMGIKGTLSSATKLDGTFFTEHFWISSDAPEKSIGEKLTLSESTADKDGKSALLARLFQKMAQGAPTGPFADDAPDMRLPTDEQLRPLGKVEAIRFLGERTIGKEASAANLRSVYDIEFFGDDMICEIHQNVERAIDYFDCG